MRTVTRFVSGMLVVIATACGDAGQQPVGVSGVRVSAIGSAHIGSSSQGKNPAKPYHVEVDRGRKTIHLSSMDNPPTSSFTTSCVETDQVAEGAEPAEPCGSGGEAAEPTYVEFDVTGDNSVLINTQVPWDPSYETAGDDGTRWICPVVSEHLHFSWKDRFFQTRGYSRLVQRLPSTIGVPKGRYQLPFGPWISSDGKAMITAGTVDATCWVRYENWSSLGIVFQVGFLAVYRYSGDFRELDGPTNASYGGGGGSDPFEELTEEERGVVEDYLRDGTCTAGWVIVVDGERVC